MNKLYYTLFVAAFLLGSCKRSDFDSDREVIRHDGKRRAFLIHTPPSYDGSQPLSMIIALHGGTGSAKGLEDQSKLSNYADQEGFIAVYPDGWRRTWNAGGCCGPAMNKDVDDVGFISKVIDHMLANYNIDADRVYVTGMSNGGFMAYRLACEIPDKIAAIAPVAASMNVTSCSPSSPVSIIHMHSYNDSNVPYTGGVGDGISEHYQPPLDSVFAVWSTVNGCTVEDVLEYDGTDYDLRTWSNPVTGSEIHFYNTHDGGHSWPMGHLPYDGADAVSTAINANVYMWSFFQDHPKVE